LTIQFFRAQLKAGEMKVKVAALEVKEQLRREAMAAASQEPQQVDAEPNMDRFLHQLKTPKEGSKE
jgi:hypothetical protein